MKLYAASYLLPVAGLPLAGGALAVENGEIVAVGTLDLLRVVCPGEVVEYPGCVIMPGLVNAHSHLELTHFPAWKMRHGMDYAPRTFVDWLVQVVKIRRGLSPEDVRLSVQEGLRICRESGTTTLGEILTARDLIPLYAASPLAGRLYFEAIGQDPARCTALLGELEQAASRLEGGFLPGLSPHTPYTVSEEFGRELGRRAREWGLPCAIHVAETAAEEAFLFDTSGPLAETFYPHVHWEQYLPAARRTTPVRYLDSLGLLGPDTAAIHCVHVTPADAEILREREVSIVLCPRSNDRLNVGTAPAHLFKKLGIPLALGTDSLASNDSLSLFEEARFAATRWPGLFSPEELLFMITLGGAQVLGLDDVTGSLTPGKRADFLVVEATGTPEQLPERIISQGKLVEVFVQGASVSGLTTD
jgi:cytosine/adenosine deaminase-related metal-dependent hydrolase